jgi:hypothetical protein
MKQSTMMIYVKHSVLVVLLAMCNLIVWAQDSGSTAVSTTTTSTSSTTEQTWYTEPWVWIVGGAVLLLLIVALLRGNNGGNSGRTDRVTVTKSVKTDTDI